MTYVAVSSHQVSSMARRAAAMVVAAMMSWPGADAFADQHARASATREWVETRDTPADLEKAFWACDYAAATRRVDGGEGAMCVAVYEQLKIRKFDGDFQAFLLWWQQNKVAQHQALAARAAATASPTASRAPR